MHHSGVIALFQKWEKEEWPFKLYKTIIDKEKKEKYNSIMI